MGEKGKIRGGGGEGEQEASARTREQGIHREQVSIETN